MPAKVVIPASVPGSPLQDSSFKKERLLPFLFVNSGFFLTSPFSKSFDYILKKGFFKEMLWFILNFLELPVA